MSAMQRKRYCNGDGVVASSDRSGPIHKYMDVSHSVVLNLSPSGKILIMREYSNQFKVHLVISCKKGTVSIERVATITFRALQELRSIEVKKVLYTLENPRALVAFLGQFK